jgi:hypothetical protein
MGHHQPIELLPDMVGSFAAQEHLPAAQVSFEFVEGGLDLPALRVEGCQFFGGCGFRIQDGGDDPVAEFVLRRPGCIRPPALAPRPIFSASGP